MSGQLPGAGPGVRWWGHAAGLAALVVSVGIALALATSLEPTPVSGAHTASLVLLAALGAGIVAWTGPRLHAMDRDEPAADAGALKEEFLATVSHELRTPLNAILGWTELLRMPRGVSFPQVARGLEVIERNARRQLALVEELLAAAEPATAPDAWRAIDVRELVRSVIAGIAPSAAIARVALDEEPGALGADPATAHPVRVRGDAVSLRLALRHVLENAIRLTPAGGRVATRVRQSGDRALVFVTDTGAGIDTARVEQVFEPFTQQDPSSARAHGGLGLGLTVARKLVERHGGHVDLRSDAGGGSTLLVTLPATHHD